MIKSCRQAGITTRYSTAQRRNMHGAVARNRIKNGLARALGGTERKLETNRAAAYVALYHQPAKARSKAVCNYCFVAEQKLLLTLVLLQTSMVSGGELTQAFFPFLSLIAYLCRTCRPQPNPFNLPIPPPTLQPPQLPFPSPPPVLQNSHTAPLSRKRVDVCKQVAQHAHFLALSHRNASLSP